MAPVKERPAREFRQQSAVLNRFREMLQAQRDKFHRYLSVLDRQKDAIDRGSAEEVVTYVEMEEQLLADIFSIQKVINPLDKMYQTFSPGQTPDTAQLFDEVGNLKFALEGLGTEVAVRVAQNQELLSQKMSALYDEITALRANSPYRGSRSVYSGPGTASVIDIRG